MSLDSCVKKCTSLLPYAAGIHFDCMDGIFVKNTRWTVEEINQLRTHKEFKNTPFWIHLMVQNPETFVSRLDLFSGDIVSFHFEALYGTTFPLSISKNSEAFDRTEKLIETLLHKNIIPSLAVNPTTPFDAFKDLLFLIDHLLIMSVQPGLSGQSFLHATYEKIEEITAFIEGHELSLTVAVDGGVTKENIKDLQNTAINAVALTSALFDDTIDPIKTIQAIRDSVST